MESETRHFHFFCLLSGGAKGFNASGTWVGPSSTASVTLKMTPQRSLISVKPQAPWCRAGYVGPGLIRGALPTRLISQVARSHKPEQQSGLHDLYTLSLHLYEKAGKR
jgi:hypothetical protein